MFTSSGGLQPAVVNRSVPIVHGPSLGNSAVVNGLTANGTRIGDWWKYATPRFQSLSGRFEVHFYRNKATGDINYQYDYKVVFTG